MTVGAPDPLDVVRALRGGVATLDALAARMHLPRDELVWALEEALRQGWAVSSDPGCGPQGVCATGAPVVYAITDTGRRAAL